MWHECRVKENYCHCALERVNLMRFGSEGRGLTAHLPAVHEQREGLSLAAQLLARTVHSAGCECIKRPAVPCFGPVENSYAYFA
jgi:hypothetical protein